MKVWKSAAVWNWNDHKAETSLQVRFHSKKRIMNFIFIETHKNKIKESGTSMKKAISCFLFVLTIAILVFNTYFGIVGATKVKARLVELEARGASGHEYLGWQESSELDFWRQISAFGSSASLSIFVYYLRRLPADDKNLLDKNSSTLKRWIFEWFLVRTTKQGTNLARRTIRKAPKIHALRRVRMASVTLSYCRPRRNFPGVCPVARLKAT